jgi:hypothetical protein
MTTTRLTGITSSSLSSACQIVLPYSGFCSSSVPTSTKLLSVIGGPGGELPLLLAAHPGHPPDLSLKMVKLLISHGHAQVRPALTT